MPKFCINYYDRYAYCDIDENVIIDANCYLTDMKIEKDKKITGKGRTLV